MNGTQIIELDLRTLSTECKKKCIGTLRKDCYLLFNLVSDIRDDADNGIQTLLSLEKKYADKPVF